MGNRLAAESHRREADGCRNFAMEISPAYVGIAIERRQADTG